MVCGITAFFYIYILRLFLSNPIAGLRCLIVEVSRSHRDTHPVGLLWKSDQPVAEAAAYRSLFKH